MASLARYVCHVGRANFRKLLFLLLVFDVLFIAKFAYEFADNQHNNKRSLSGENMEHDAAKKGGDVGIEPGTQSPEELEMDLETDVRKRKRGLNNRIMIQQETRDQYDELPDARSDRAARILKNAAQMPTWQKLTDGPTAFVFKAFYDSRRNVPTVVTLALIHKDVLQRGMPSVFCYFPVTSTLSAQKGETSTMQEIPGNRYDRGYDYGAWLLRCKIPYIEGIKEDRRPPETVMLDAGSLLGSIQLPVRIPTLPLPPSAEDEEEEDEEEAQKQKTFGICLAPLSHDTKAQEIVQMVEMSKLLGVKNVILHMSSLNSDLMTAESVDKILRVYDDEGFVEELPWSLPVQESQIYNAGQAISFLDCFYTGLHHFSYIIFTKIHEILIPQDFLQYDTLFTELTETAPNKSSGFCFFGAVFSDPKSSAVYRRPIGNIIPAVDIYTRTDAIRDQIRCVCDTSRVEFIDSDATDAFPISNNFIKPQKVSPDIALNHIYDQCSESTYGDVCNGRFRFDRTNLRYRSDFILAYRKAISSMQDILRRNQA